jgi:Tfp pilus assembly protein PilE
VRYRSEAGFTIVDMLITVAIIGVLAGMAVPALKDVTNRMKLAQGQREVQAEMQVARLKAVTTNRHIRMRFNCPAATQYRMVEVVGPTVDDAVDRCSATKYPELPPDNNPLTRPNHDGPIRYLPRTVTFGAAASLEFAPDGTVWYQSGGAYIPVPDPDGTAITLVKATDVVKITVNRFGKIQLVQAQY